MRKLKEIINRLVVLLGIVIVSYFLIENRIIRANTILLPIRNKG